MRAHKYIWAPGTGGFFVAGWLVGYAEVRNGTGVSYADIGGPDRNLLFKLPSFIDEACGADA
jgi:hypothetical protein